jgi:hypothetical protein
MLSDATKDQSFLFIHSKSRSFSNTIHYSLILFMHLFQVLFCCKIYTTFSQMIYKLFQFFEQTPLVLFYSFVACIYKKEHKQQRHVLSFIFSILFLDRTSFTSLLFSLSPPSAFFCGFTSFALHLPRDEIYNCFKLYCYCCQFSVSSRNCLQKEEKEPI